VNPIVTFIFFIGLAFSVILSSNWLSVGIFFIIWLLLFLLNRAHIKNIIQQIKPFLLMFPILIFIYVIVTFVFTDSAWSEILTNAAFSIGKLFLLIIIMALYISISKDSDIVLALRSIWSKLNIKWKIVDDIFIFFELTMRFYPTFQQDWQTINRSKKALGLNSKLTRWEQINSALANLSGLILQSYNKADNIANGMQQRGYGKQIPRGVAFPIPFKIADFLLLFSIFVGFTLMIFYGSL